MNAHQKQVEYFAEMLRVSQEQFARGESREYSQELLDERWVAALDRFKARTAVDVNGRSQAIG